MGNAASFLVTFASHRQLSDLLHHIGGQPPFFPLHQTFFIEIARKPLNCFFGQGSLDFATADQFAIFVNDLTPFALDVPQALFDQQKMT